MKQSRWATEAFAVLAFVILGFGCTGEEATPIDIDSGNAVDSESTVDPGDTATSADVATPHQLEQSEAMQLAAEKQCLDAPEMEEAEVRAVDPADGETVLAEITVDCAEIRATQK